MPLLFGLKILSFQGACDVWLVRSFRMIKLKGDLLNVSVDFFGDTFMRYEDIPPYAPTLMESTRAIGYSIEAAIADIIDNSIVAVSYTHLDVYKRQVRFRVKNRGAGSGSFAFK